MVHGSLPQLGIALLIQINEATSAQIPLLKRIEIAARDKRRKLKLQCRPTIRASRLSASAGKSAIVRKRNRDTASEPERCLRSRRDPNGTTERDRVSPSELPQPPPAPIHGTVSTIAGGGEFGAHGAGHADGPALTCARFNEVSECIESADGSFLYIVDCYNHRICRLQDGVVSTLAGGRGAGFADGAGRHAKFDEPAAAALDPVSGHLLVADRENGRIREVTAHGVVTTLAGNGKLSTADGPAEESSFARLVGLAVGTDGAVFVTERYSDVLRRISSPGEDGGGGRVVSTLIDPDGMIGGEDGTFDAARMENPKKMSLGPDGALYVTDNHANFGVRRVDLARERVATISFCEPADLAIPELRAVAVGADGSMYVADHESRCVFEVERDGIVRRLAGPAALGVPAPAAARRTHYQRDDDPWTDDGPAWGLRFDAPRGRLLVSVGHRVLAIALAGAAQRRAARALPFVRAWALVQRGRACAPSHAALAATASESDDDELSPDDDLEESARALSPLRLAASEEALWRLAKQPVLEILARVVSFVTGDDYAILAGGGGGGGGER